MLDAMVNLSLLMVFCGYATYAALGHLSLLHLAVFALL